MRSLFTALRNIGLAIISILLLIELSTAYPLPAIAQPSPAPSVAPKPITSGAREAITQPSITKKDPPAQPTPKQELGKPGGPYDLKKIQKSYKSIYGS
jgi:hypothetical protein